MTASCGSEAVSLCASHRPGLILLDLGLPDIDGIEVIRTVRTWSSAVIIIISARGEDSDKIAALDAGADDYMTKPFSPDELFARVRALTRRQGEVVLDELKFDGLVLNLSTCDLSNGSKSVHLNYKEFEIMKILMQNPQSVTPKEDLIVKVWGYDSNAVDNNVEVYISFLRKKLDFIQAHVEIVSLRKVGYRLEIREDAKEG